MKFRQGKILDKFCIKRDGRKTDVVFRYPRMGDAKEALRHINQLVEENALILAVEKQTLINEKEWLKDKIEKMKKRELILIVIEADEKYCGNAQMIRGRYGSGHVGSIAIGLSKDARGIGIGTRLINFLMDISKKEFGIDVVRIEYLKGNDAAKHLYEKLGFIEAGTIPRMRKRGNAYHDEVFMYKVLA